MLFIGLPRQGCAHGDVRLAARESEFEGLVEVCVDGVWGLVCPNAWDAGDAAVVCTQLQGQFIGI